MMFIHATHRLMSNLPMKRKFLLQTGLVAVGIIVLAVVAARIQYLDLNSTRQAGLRAQTEMAIGVIERYAARVEAGEMDLAAAHTAALETLKSMQATKGVDYFFVTDEVPNMLMHPTRPDLTGKPVANVLSPDGKAIFPAFVKAAQGGGGFVDYTWAKAGKDKPVQKTSFATLYQPWGWVIGTGVYLDDTPGRGPNSPGS
ncbi:cache domain-containing protein [Pseudoxanthomonas sp. NC8]|nr:cache domain-containing protein [Pseudoxanthomonas sp. NC8]